MMKSCGLGLFVELLGFSSSSLVSLVIVRCKRLPSFHQELNKLDILLMCWLFCVPGYVWDCVGGRRIGQING